jgi:hypothetical protein
MQHSTRERESISIDEMFFSTIPDDAAYSISTVCKNMPKEVHCLSVRILFADFIVIGIIVVLDTKVERAGLLFDAPILGTDRLCLVQLEEGDGRCRWRFSSLWSLVSSWSLWCS